MDEYQQNVVWIVSCASVDALVDALPDLHLNADITGLPLIVAKQVLIDELDAKRE